MDSPTFLRRISPIDFPVFIKKFPGLMSGPVNFLFFILLLPPFLSALFFSSCVLFGFCSSFIAVSSALSIIAVSIILFIYGIVSNPKKKK